MVQMLSKVRRGEREGREGRGWERREEGREVRRRGKGREGKRGRRGERRREEGKEEGGGASAMLNMRQLCDNIHRHMTVSHHKD